MLDRLMLNSGCDIPITSMGVEVRQPTLKDIAKFGEKNLAKVLSLIDYSKKDYEEYLEAKLDAGEFSQEEVEAVKTDLMFMTDFQLILEAAKEETVLRASFTSLFYFLFPTSKRVVIEEDRFVSISFTDRKAITLSEEMFLEFKDVVLEMFLMKGVEKSAFNPVNDKAADIARKIEERRRKLAAEKGEDEDSSPIATNASIVSTLDGISIREVYQYTLPQLYQQLERAMTYSTFKDQITLGAFAGLKDVELADYRQKI